MIEFVEPVVFRKGAYERNTTKKQKTERKRSTRGLPKSLVDRLPMTRWQEPANSNEECTALVYRRTCPVEECEYLSGKYVSHNSALKALIGHLRWVHNYG